MHPTKYPANGSHVVGGCLSSNSSASTRCGVKASVAGGDVRSRMAVVSNNRHHCIRGNGLIVLFVFLPPPLPWCATRWRDRWSTVAVKQTSNLHPLLASPCGRVVGDCGRDFIVSLLVPLEFDRQC